MSDYSELKRLVYELVNASHLEIRDERYLHSPAFGIYLGDLLAENESLRADAERYRWLILHADEIYVHPDGYFGQNLSVDSFEAKKGDGIKTRVDEEIDANMNRSPENPS